MPASLSPYETGLHRVAANSQPLTPLNFLRRAAMVFPDKTAVVHGETRHTYRSFYSRARRLASALTGRGVGRGDTVSVMAANIPALLEAHYGAPMAGAAINALNIRLDPTTIAFILDHADTKVLLTDKAFSETIREALSLATVRPMVLKVSPTFRSFQ